MSDNLFVGVLKPQGEGTSPACPAAADVKIEGIVAPELKTIAEEKGKPLNTALAAEIKNLEEIIEKLKKRKEEEQHQEAERELRWQEEQRLLEEKHKRDFQHARCSKNKFN